ncbi:hypothetical protein [Flavobacterium tyrosinilyticum]|uniref:hypothetical protein n=1 Tax=Flavobacterium tyrosinilyticum TaxID=1658740 RepID=UPI00202E0E81|nr:hypothetical protein [Flavobacterium tyrosinilyticum]MCM0667292.1 hypothetical protein [Flavobacterium tyrosinilyticum]
MKIFILLVTCILGINSQGQEKVKDTLFFAYDSNYITIYPENPNYYIKDGSGARIGGFYFTEVQKINVCNTKSKEINLKEFIRSSKFYNENRRLKLRDYELWDYLKGYTIFLVKSDDAKKSYIQVKSSFEIE